MINSTKTVAAQERTEKHSCDMPYNANNNSASDGINVTPSEQDCYISQYCSETKAVAVNLPVAPMVPEDKIALVKATCCKNCTDDEFAMFLELANRYQLDPFVHQIWAVKYDKSQPAQIFCGRDGYLAIAHRSGVFDGIQSIGNYDENNKLVSATATVWRKDCSHPFEVTVRAREYCKSTSVWSGHPDTMLCKVAECQCLRKAFSVSGLYDPDEMPANMTKSYVEPAVIDCPKPAVPAKKLNGVEKGGDDDISLF